MSTSPPTTLSPTTLAPTTLAPTTLAPTTLTPTTTPPTSLAPTTTLTTLTPTTPSPRNPLNDKTFNCKADNYAGVLFVDTYIEGVAASPSYGLTDLELVVETTISGNVPTSALYILEDLALIVDTYITGWAVANDERSNWVGWSKIGEADFTIDMVNDAGFKTLEWSGYIYNVLKLDKNIVIYGSGGITLAFPVSEPIATFGFKPLLNIGIKNKTAVTGDEFVHFFIDTLGHLYKLSSEGLEKLGYEEFLLPLINPVLTWDAAERRLYISSASVGYIFNEGSLTGGYTNLTGLYRIKDNIEAISPETVIADAVELVTDIIDFRRRGMKSIESLQFDVTSDVDIYVAIDYRYRKNEEFQTTNWSPLNDSGVAHIRASGTEFRIRCKGLKYGTFDLSYISVQYKFIDQRFSRDPNNRRGGLDDY